MKKEKKFVVLQKQLTLIHSRRLARECSKLDPEAEKAKAEEGLVEDVKNWPEY